MNQIMDLTKLELLDLKRITKADTDQWQKSHNAEWLLDRQILMAKLDRMTVQAEATNDLRL